MDNHSKTARSYNMSRIRSKNTKPEELVRKFLFAAGFRYRKNDNDLPGHPDIVFPKYKTVVFINGCFWHGHSGCKYFIWPKSNINYWENKLKRNIERDKTNYIALGNLGWRVIIVWECELRPDKKDNTLQNLVNNILHQD